MHPTSFFTGVQWVLITFQGRLWFDQVLEDLAAAISFFFFGRVSISLMMMLIDVFSCGC